MVRILKPLGLAALVALAAPAFAQDTAPAIELDMGTDANAPVDGAQPQVATSYVDGVFGDWQRECLRNPDGDDPCQITQLLAEGPDAAPIGKMTVGLLPEGQEAVAGSMIIVPLGTLLTQQLVMGVDSAAPKRYPFRFCTQQGCAAQIGLTQADIDGFKKGAAAKIVIAPAVRPDARVEVEVSLKGFTDAFASLTTPGSGGEAPAEAPAQ